MIHIVLCLFFQIPTITLPPKIMGSPGEFISIPSKTESKIVKWVSLDKGLNLFPTDLLKDTRTLVVVSNAEGVYRVFAYTGDVAGPSDPAVTTVYIGVGVDPTVPPVPVPDDKKTDINLAAKKEDPVAVDWLSRFYTELALEVQKVDYEIVGDVFKTAKVAINKQFKPEEMTALRSLIGKRLNDRLPKDSDQKLDKAIRDLMTKEFNQIAKELK